ncbi:Mov34/MPN/PAD-1 family protein [Toxoplasma gondii RUB]|uniref:COP9 signalosome complex subunit 5 n=2 Tax=Toxoplasma gondii TaxID=5811 RepID=A0A086LM55_TOXGO|nr:Mov34/MPN/PAD-1 family protein [Toxoplasma gondii p89]KFG57723.1 Mov34/MPN/PAD-1 family protein [Toxoplasma gondii RUB]
MALSLSASGCWASLPPTLSLEDFCLAHSPSDREQQELHSRLPRLLPTSFSTVRLSPLALLQMFLHARQGIPLEVMGLMLGSVSPISSSVKSASSPLEQLGDQAFVVHSVFRLPVEGTETRVNAGAEANEYMVDFVQRAEEALSPPVRPDEPDEGVGLCVVGWYHSHPGYRCWLSGIDVETQKLHQRGQDPFVAVVVDPTRTLATGEVDIGAFRCYPDHSQNARLDSVQKSRHDQAGVPAEKASDFGVHWREYYKLNVELLCSSLDALLIERLSEAAWFAPLLRGPQDQTAATRRAYRTSQILNVASKARQAETSLFPALPKPCSSLSLHTPHPGPSTVSSTSSSSRLQAPEEVSVSGGKATGEASLLARPGAQERLVCLLEEEEQTERLQQQSVVLLQSHLEKKYARILQNGDLASAEEEREDRLDELLREAHQLACDQRQSVLSAAVGDIIFGREAESTSWLAIKRRLREERGGRSSACPSWPGSVRL